MKTQSGTFKGYHLAIMLVCFFGVIIMVNFTMAFMASSHWTGLVVKNSYVASQKFNGALEGAKKQRALGWTSNVTYHKGAFNLTFQTRDGDLVQPDIVTAEIGRPAFEQEDHQILFKNENGATWVAQDDLAAGIWKVSINAEIKGKPYRRDLRVYVGKDGEGRIE